MKNLNIIMEKQSDGYVAYPLGVAGAVVAQGDTYDEAMANVKSAIDFHVETFGPGAFEDLGNCQTVFYGIQLPK